MSALEVQTASQHHFAVRGGSLQGSQSWISNTTVYEWSWGIQVCSKLAWWSKIHFHIRSQQNINDTDNYSKRWKERHFSFSIPTPLHHGPVQVCFNRMQSWSLQLKWKWSIYVPQQWYCWLMWTLHTNGSANKLVSVSHFRRILVTTVYFSLLSDYHSTTPKHCFPAPSSEVCHNWLRH